MGTRLRFSPTDGQIPVLIAFCVLILCVNVASCCEGAECWMKFNDAKIELHENVPGVPNQEEIRCVTLRTYSQCLRNLTGCKGNIRFHSVQQMIIKRMKDNNCDVNGPVYNPDLNNHNPAPEPAVCSYEHDEGEKKYKHCGLFGDPHLRTFGGEFQTCKVEGAWPLIDNDYVTVQVTNDEVTYDASATATSKLTVMVKSADCADGENFVTYQAQTDHLPSVFDDGRSSFGPGESVSIREKTTGKHVEIYLRHIDTTILVRQVGRYLTFSVRMPQDVVSNSRSNTEDVSLQLCVDGCPVRERIDYKKYLASKNSKYKSVRVIKHNDKHTMTREEAVERCRRANVKDFYFDSCVFDLLTTGDVNFTLAANVAMEDIHTLHPHSGEEQQNRTDLHVYDELYSQLFEQNTSLATRFCTQWWLMLCSLLVCRLISTPTSFIT